MTLNPAVFELDFQPAEDAPLVLDFDCRELAVALPSPAVESEEAGQTPVRISLSRRSKDE